LNYGRKARYCSVFYVGSLLARLCHGNRPAPE